MFLKIFSYILIYLILFNSISNILFINNVNAQWINLANKNQHILKTKDYADNRIIVKFKKSSWINTLSNIKSTIEWKWFSNIQFFKNMDIWVLYI
jgi:hypothetical protein